VEEREREREREREGERGRERERERERGKDTIMVMGYENWGVLRVCTSHEVAALHPVAWIQAKRTGTRKGQ
jgi:hypothetical protein